MTKFYWNSHISWSIWFCSVSLNSLFLVVRSTHKKKNQCSTSQLHLHKNQHLFFTSYRQTHNVGNHIKSKTTLNTLLLFWSKNFICTPAILNLYLWFARQCLCVNILHFRKLKQNYTLRGVVITLYYVQHKYTVVGFLYNKRKKNYAP